MLLDFKLRTHDTDFFCAMDSTVKVARHPVTLKPITIAQYRFEFGPPYQGQIKLLRPEATCPACHEALLIRGEKVEADRMTFSHYPASATKPSVFCPIKAAGKHKYEVLCPVDEDPLRTRQLRESFFANWKLHWRRFAQYVGYADIGDFISMIKVADKSNVWRYRSLQEHEVIIVFMLTSDFKPVLGKGTEPLRKNWVRFWFESRATSFEDFWNLQTNHKVIIRTEYNVPVGKRGLKPDYLEQFKVLDMSHNYLANRREGDDHVPDYVERRMIQAFRNLLGISSVVTGSLSRSMPKL